MTRTITSRPRMAAIDAPGTVRARRWHGTRPPLERRWRRARLPPALGLDGLRRPHRHSPHHGPRLAACRVVAHRDEGITAISTAKIRARQWPRPVFKANSRIRTPLPSLSLRRRRRHRAAAMPLVW